MSYPRDLKIFSQRMTNYSRNTIKLTPYRTNTIKNGDIITLELPNSMMVDTDTLVFHFKGTTTTSSGHAEFPKNIESIISKITIEINGQTLNSMQYYNDLVNVLLNHTQGSDLKGKRALYQHSTRSGTPGANQTSVPFKVHNWAGFLGSVKPEVLDLALLGSVRIHIQLAGTEVLVGDVAVGPAFQLDDLFFTVDAVSIDDGIYYAAKNNYLASGGVFEMPFDCWYSSLFSTGGTYLQSSRFSVSTQSLDAVMACFPKSRALSSNNASLGASDYFTYPGLVTDYQFTINNVALPQYRAGRDDAYSLTLNNLNLSQDTLGGIDPLITSYSVYNSNAWLASIRLDHPCADGERFASGISTAGTNAQIEFLSSGSDSINNCLLFAKTTAVLRVAAGKSLEIVS